jgi:hypothetical protein
MVIKPMYPIFQAFDQKRQRGTHFPFHNRFDHATAARICGSSTFTSAMSVFAHLLPGKQFRGRCQRS